MMSSTISSIASSSSSHADHVAAPPLTDLEIRIQQIRQRCDELRKQKPKYFSLYEFGFAISVIGAAAAIFLRDSFLFAFSVGIIGPIFWKTISRNNDRIKSIDGLEKAEIDQGTVSNFMDSLKTNLKTSQDALDQIQSGLNADSNIPDVMATIGPICQNITGEIQKSREFLRAYDEYVTHAFRLQLDILETRTQKMQLPFIDLRTMQRRIRDVTAQLGGFEGHITRFSSYFQTVVRSQNEWVEQATLLMNRWFI